MEYGKSPKTIPAGGGDRLAEEERHRRKIRARTETKCHLPLLFLLPIRIREHENLQGKLKRPVRGLTIHNGQVMKWLMVATLANSLGKFSQELRAENGAGKHLGGIAVSHPDTSFRWNIFTTIPWLAFCLYHRLRRWRIKVIFEEEEGRRRSPENSP